MGKISTAMSHRVAIPHEQEHSQGEISRCTGLSRCEIQALLKKHKETGQVDKRRSGRPRKLTKSKSISRSIHYEIEKNPAKLLPQIFHTQQEDKYISLRYEELLFATIYMAELQQESHC